ncbi:hypothetical protein Q3G72_004387 [Acer saccharum]|nr:hypothetical protein Q3G72_004387 [Acer saccharum]
MACLIKPLLLLPLSFWIYSTFLRDLWHTQNSSLTAPIIGGCHGGYGGSSARGGWWELASENSGVSAMHMFIFPNTDKAIMFDGIVFGKSQIQLPSATRILGRKIKTNADLWAHAVEFDIDSAAIRPLKILTDTWASAGGLSANGTFVLSGGWSDGQRTLRYLSGCSTCNWEEFTGALAGKRWYLLHTLLNCIYRNPFNLKF